MGFRFHRSIRLLPGVRLNLSKSGVSASVGTRGAWLTFGKRGTRATVGIPGTGISYTKTSPSSHSQQEQQQDVVQDPEAPSRSWSMAGALTILLILLAIAGGIGWLIGVAMR